MGYPKLVVYLRHAESEGNVATREEMLLRGTAPHAYIITSRGRRQAAFIGDWLDRTYGRFDMHFISTYKRTFQTLHAAGLAARPGRSDSRLDETQFGIHHFHHPDEIGSLYPRERARQNQLTNYWYRPFGGENWPDAELRLHSFVDMLHRDWSGKKVLVVAHGNLFRAWRRVMEGRSIEETMALSGFEALPNCGVAAYRGIAPFYAPWNRNQLRLELLADPCKEVGKI